MEDTLSSLIEGGSNVKPQLRLKTAYSDLTRAQKYKEIINIVVAACREGKEIGEEE
ncbi:hypothetical protein Phum_PHUM342830 [Pediculus humanus corporis]|uniref:Uncharacterized protein n=1 Tax=Pediculus humanus subsp. corporis TaxID=121224 RepID=E0VNR2_PEDHC|nr:uncharacterized protein Phum_PHUM342830 [Pediculus humanus corporis]EEB15018.1 hypothetical protein Phum_PHUM342830 [Pediculus humanus corporis]